MSSNNNNFNFKIMTTSLPIFTLNTTGKMTVTDVNGKVVYKTNGRSNYYMVVLTYNAETEKWVEDRRFGRPDLVDDQYIAEMAAANKNGLVWSIVAIDGHVTTESIDAIVGDGKDHKIEWMKVRIELLTGKKDLLDRQGQRKWDFIVSKGLEFEYFRFERNEK